MPLHFFFGVLHKHSTHLAHCSNIDRHNLKKYRTQTEKKQQKPRGVEKRQPNKRSFTPSEVFVFSFLFSVETPPTLGVILHKLNIDGDCEQGPKHITVLLITP